ncbi:beta-Ig-H3/fasciclin [Monoraphidium neglectum]|uniref:Beta-Ig-H3/fasciclin n=1 Tax=Monoraphidium neglectum TaxID=145388 RepID=A0A0D2KDH6_9CHLO|nr:beta-Ig-H3/fasciclin [Monoraphidium neglectum]KIY93873.1 beta-Ig-H3/fasciclin [Monoraphidium neglectum]|eukprot:XP_013892893.1 beta-Ig-H3/fasciclin [Monoraphidium neglectum]
MQRPLAIVCLMAVCLAGTAQAQSYPSFVAALNQPTFSRLNAVVSTLGLTQTFSNPALKVTVFVPTNTGFSAAEKATGISFATLQSQKSLLQQIVYYHIVKQVVKAPLPAGPLPTFVTGKDLKGAGNKVIGIGSSANIVQPNVPCGQGIAHAIDNVLLFLSLGGR